MSELCKKKLKKFVSGLPRIVLFLGFLRLRCGLDTLADSLCYLVPGIEGIKFYTESFVC